MKKAYAFKTSKSAIHANTTAGKSVKGVHTPTRTGFPVVKTPMDVGNEAIMRQRNVSNKASKSTIPTDNHIATKTQGLHITGGAHGVADSVTASHKKFLQITGQSKDGAVSKAAQTKINSSKLSYPRK